MPTPVFTLASGCDAATGNTFIDITAVSGGTAPYEVEATAGPAPYTAQPPGYYPLPAALPFRISNIANGTARVAVFDALANYSAYQYPVLDCPVVFDATSGCDAATGEGFLELTRAAGGVEPYELVLTYVAGPAPNPGPQYYPLPAAFPFRVEGAANGTYSAEVFDGHARYSLPQSLSLACPGPPPPRLVFTPPAFVAAHLPVILAVLAPPVGRAAARTPAVLLACVDVAAGAGWREVARIRRAADAASGTARFELSAYLSGLFTPTPPDESGANDPALAVRYRVRVGQANTARTPYTGAPGTEAVTFTGWAVNAAVPVNPFGAALPQPLGPPRPHDTVPPGYATFRTYLSASGVVNANEASVVAADWPCPVRQFVWLDPTGAWQWGLFTGRHEHGTEVSDGTQVRRAAGDRYASRGDVRRTLRVYSDKVDRATFDGLVGVRDSLQAYERLPTGAYVAVLVEAGSFRDYQETDKLFTVEFLARYPVLARQTQ